MSILKTIHGLKQASKKKKKVQNYSPGLPLTFCFHWMLSVMRDPGAGLCPGEYHAAPASGGCVLPLLSPAVFPPVPAHRKGKRGENHGRG